MSCKKPTESWCKWGTCSWFWSLAKSKAVSSFFLPLVRFLVLCVHPMPAKALREDLMSLSSPMFFGLPVLTRSMEEGPTSHPGTGPGTRTDSLSLSLSLSLLHTHTHTHTHTHIHMRLNSILCTVYLPWFISESSTSHCIPQPCGKKTPAKYKGIGQAVAKTGCVP